MKIIYSIAQSMHKPIQRTYPCLELTQSLARMINNKQQKKEGLVGYTERFKE